jgi:hypothetical protein
MVILSFSIDALYEKIWRGTKTRSMRPRFYGGKENSKWGAVYKKFQNYERIWIDLYWKSRSKTNRQKFFIAELTTIEIKKLGELTLEEAQADGFESWEECRNWFQKTYKIPAEQILEFELYLIQWQPGNCNQCAYRYRCQHRHITDADNYELAWPHDFTNLCASFFPKTRKAPKFQLIHIEEAIANGLAKLKTK